MTHDAVDLEHQLREQRLTCTSILHQADGFPDDRDAFSTGSMSPSPFVKEQLSSHYDDAEQGWFDRGGGIGAMLVHHVYHSAVQGNKLHPRHSPASQGIMWSYQGSRVDLVVE
jgi:hypothetical protein